MAHVIMIQGTMSNAGKSLITAGLCRIFHQDGYRVAPFKSQNMALNSYITEDGLEIGRAQAMQAQAAGIAPSVCMNPILLKPTDDVGSQVIVNGEVLGNMPARQYFAYKKKLIPDIMKAYEHLARENDIIVIEGAGSPAEINLKENDIVNMGLAGMVDAPVLLVGDIDPGGVFAQLYGTWALLEEDERSRIRGMIINKFRGDESLLTPGVRMIEERMGIPVVGVVPYTHLVIDDEDSLSEALGNGPSAKIDIAVVKLPHMSNYTDFTVLCDREDISLRYITDPADIRDADLMILPGTKSTISDLKWLTASGMKEAVLAYAESGRPVLGICGGYQMLGTAVEDPQGVESGGSCAGLGLLPVRTTLTGEKTRTRVHGRFLESADAGRWSFLGGMELEGYEIHMGKTTPTESDSSGFEETKSKHPAAEITDRIRKTTRIDGMVCGNVMGTYVHGVLDGEGIAEALLGQIGDRKHIKVKITRRSRRTFAEQQYDLLAGTLRDHMDIPAIYAMMGISGS